jgi:hypothetical protein
VRLALAVVLASAIFVSCSPRNEEKIRYAREHAAELVASTRSLWMKYRERTEIPEAEIPQAVRALEPAQGFRAEHGIVIYVDTNYANITGVFVRFDPSFQPPPNKPDSSDAGYERIADDVYWMVIPR